MSRSYSTTKVNIDDPARLNVCARCGFKVVHPTMVLQVGTRALDLDTCDTCTATLREDPRELAVHRSRIVRQVWSMQRRWLRWTPGAPHELFGLERSEWKRSPHGRTVASIIERAALGLLKTPYRCEIAMRGVST